VLKTLCFFGTYDRETPRFKMLVNGFQSQGGEVLECHADLWPKAGARALFALQKKFEVSRICVFLSAQRRLLAQAEVLRQTDAILVAYPGHLDMPLARLLAWYYHKPLIFDPFISLWDTAVGDRRLFFSTSWQAHLLRFLDRIALRLADKVIADTPQQADFYADLAGIHRDAIGLVPIGADETLFYPREISPNEAGICEVLFYGSMIPLHGIEVILEAAALLKDDPSIRFHLIGEGQFPLEARLAEMALPNVRWTPFLPYEELPEAIARATICLGIFGTSDKARRVVPHKIYEAAAMGKPIITGKSPAIRWAFPEGLIEVSSGDPVALASAIVTLGSMVDTRINMGVLLQAGCENRFGLHGTGNSLADTLG
jgi:glycosyltransferase involved in cell wall biosynthesis